MKNNPEFVVFSGFDNRAVIVFVVLLQSTGFLFILLHDVAQTQFLKQAIAKKWFAKPRTCLP
jgi:hypothetical protein